MRVLLLLLALPAVALAHGYLALPAARNVLANSDYCAQCLSAGGELQPRKGGGEPRKGECPSAACGHRQLPLQLRRARARCIPSACLMHPPRTWLEWRQG